MIVSEFEVGDQVQFGRNPEWWDGKIVAIGPCKYEGYNLEENEMLIAQNEPVNKMIVGYYAPYTKVIKGSTELISKGEGSMQNVDAIAVDTDSEGLVRGILEEVKNMNYWTIWADDIEGKVQAVANGNQCLKFVKNSRNIFENDWEITYDAGDSLPDTKFELPQDWNKVVEFLEQSETNPTLNGYEAEIDRREVSVGCWNGQVENLGLFKDFAKTIGVESGTVTVKGTDVDIQELYQFIEEVKEVVEN